MKRNLFLLVLLVLFFLPGFVFGQKLKPDTTHFWFPAYKSGELAPAKGWTRFDKLVAGNDYNLIIVGKADLQVKAYKDLQAGVPFESALQYPTMLGFAHMRADVGRARAGRGEKLAVVVANAAERGITLIRIPKPQPKEKPVAEMIQLTTDRIALYPGATYELGPVAKVMMSDSTFIAVDGFSVKDNKVRITNNGHLTAGFYPGPAIVTVYALLDRKKMLANNGNGRVDTLKKSIRVDILPFPEPKIPRPETFGLALYGHVNQDGQPGATGILKLPSGWLLGASFEGQDWSGARENGSQVYLGYSMPFLKSLSILAGFRQETQLKNRWDAWGGFVGLQFTPSIGPLSLFIQGGLQVMNTDYHEILGSLNFYNDPVNERVIRVTQPVIQAKSFKRETDFFIRAGIGIDLKKMRRVE